MSENTPNLQLPYIMPDQAQKHVTHNEALQRLDALSQIVLLDERAAPPASPSSGDCYAVSANATGIWFGHDGDIAFRQDGEWLFTKPKRGWIAWIETGQRTFCHDGASWVDLRLPPISRSDLLGINASPDTTNRLALSSPGSLFNHAGAGHQLKINKAGDAATASLLFQNNFAGRAELGLAGDNDLSFKVSPDGTTWNSGLTIDAAGVPRMPNRPACRASLNSTALSPAASSYTGFQVMSVNQGKFTLGTAVSPGTGQRLVIPATGLYAIYLTVVAITSSGHTVSLIRNTASIMAVKGNANTTTLNMTGKTIVSLTANDTLMLQHTGTAQFDFGPTKTELMMFML